MINTKTDALLLDSILNVMTMMRFMLVLLPPSYPASFFLMTDKKENKAMRLADRQVCGLGYHHSSWLVVVVVVASLASFSSFPVLLPLDLDL